MGIDYRQELRKLGHNEDAIQKAISPIEEELLSKGHSQQEVDRVLGKPTFDDTELKDFVNNAGDDVPEESEGLIEAFQSGVQASASGLLVRGELPDIQLPEDASTAERITATIGGLVSDIPFIVGGAIAGSPGGPTVSVAGAFALPAGVRKVLMDGYEHGSIDSPEEFINRLAGATIEAGKGFGVGLATGGAGKAATLLYGTKSAGLIAQSTKIGAEAAAMSTAAAGFEGRLPTRQEFSDALIIFGLGRASVGTGKAIGKKVSSVFTRIGKNPNEMVRDAEIDPTIKEDIMGDREVPRSYKELDKESKIGFTAKQKADLPEARISAKISTKVEGMKKRLTADEAYEAFVDEIYPVRKATDAVMGGKKLPANEDPYIQTRLFKGVNGKAKHYLEYGTFDAKNLKVTGPGFKQILKPVGKDIENFEAYITSKRAKELHNKGKESGFNPTDVDAVVKKFDKKYSKTFEELKEYSDRVLQHMVDQGLISKESKVLINEANKDYVPFYRNFEEKKIGKTDKKVSIFNPIKRVKGSKEDIISPLESIIKNTYTFITMAERNAVAKSFIALKDQPGGEKFIKKVKPKIVKTTIKDIEGVEDIDIFRPSHVVGLGKNNMTVFENGKATVYEVDPKMAEIFNSLGNETTNMLVKILAVPAKTLRTGVTLNPAFMVKNVIRDNILSGIQSDNGFIPFVDGLRGFSSVIKKDATYQKWLRSGGANSSIVSIDRNYMQESKWQLIQAGKIRNEIKHPWEMLRIGSEISDSMSRVGDFKKAIKADPEDVATLHKAAFDSRELSLDFARKGSQMHALNQMSAFTNAKIGGTDRFLRSLKNNPGRTAAKVAGYIMLPSALLWFANKDDARYKALPQWEKDNYLHIITDDTIYRVPRPFEPGIVFGAGTDRFLDFVLKEDPKAFDGFMDASVGQLLDPYSLMPNAAQPFVANYTNKNLFTGSPVVPKSREGLLPEYQYTPYTNELTKAASKILVSFTSEETKIDIKQRTPAAIDNYIKSWGGGVGVLVSNGTDFALRKAGILPDPVKTTEEFRKLPLVQAFMLKNPKMNTKAMQQFYKSYNNNTATIKTFNKLTKEEQNIPATLELFNSRQKYFLDLSPDARAISFQLSLAKFVEFNKTMSLEEKKQATESAYFQANYIAGQANEKAKQWEKHIKQLKKE